MTIVFAAGSIAIGHLHPLVVARLATVVERGLSVVVGDAEGVDSAVQQVLAAAGATAVTVYCSGDTPRNNVGGWPVEAIHPVARPGTRAWFTAKDLAMAEAAEYGLMIWDARSTGTLANVLALVAQRKTCVVFVNKDKAFVTVADADGIERLVAGMAAAARAKAETKMALSKRIAALRTEQLALI